MKHLHDALKGQIETHYASDPDAARDFILDQLRDGDVVMVKGSNASGVSRVARAMLAVTPHTANGGK